MAWCWQLQMYAFLTICVVHRSSFFQSYTDFINSHGHAGRTEHTAAALAGHMRRPQGENRAYQRHREVNSARGASLADRDDAVSASLSGDSLDMPDPLANDMHKGRLFYDKVLHIPESHRCPVSSMPLKQRFRIGNRTARQRLLPLLCAQMKNYLHALPCPEMERGEILRGAEARRIPLDAFGDTRISTKNTLSDREDLLLVWMVERREKGPDILGPRCIASTWFFAGYIQRHSALYE